jgi:hypothetical protein
MEKADGDDADFFTLADEPIDGLADRLDAAAHDDDDALGLGVTVVVEEMILAAGEGGEAVHRGLDDAGEFLVVAVHGLAALEVDVGVLRGAADGGAVGRQGAGPEGGDVVFVDHVAEDASPSVVIFWISCEVRKPSKKWMNGAGAEGSDVGNQGEVVGLLHGFGGEEDAAGGAAGHDVGVVAEDREALGGERAGAHVQGQRHELAGDLVEVGNHQQEALRGGERGRERAREERAVHGTGGAALGLHFHDARDLAPEVGFAGGGPFVARLGHGRGRGDRIDRDDLVEPVGDGGDGFVGVERGEGGSGLGRTHEMKNWAAERPNGAHNGKKRAS